MRYGTEFKVGLFAAVALATLGYMFFVLSPTMFEDTEYNTYYTVLRNASGIVPKTHVKTNGVTVGKVSDISLKANTTRVTLDVQQDVKIPVGSRIEIRSVGLLGDVHLEIVRAKDTGKYIEDSGFIPQTEDSVTMQALVGLMGDIAHDVKKITRTMANVLGSKKGERSVSNILTNVERVTSNVKETTAALQRVVGQREQDLGEIVTDMKDGIEDMRRFSAGLKDLVDQENRERFDRILSSFDHTMADVQGSARKINLIAEKVEKGEGTIGKLVNDAKTIDELEGAITDVREVLSPATDLEVGVDYHGEVRQDNSSQHYFNMVFRTRPDRYYLLGVSDGKVAKVTTTKSEEEIGGGDADRTRTVEEIKRERRLRFNLQFAKRWYNVALRFGLFETTGGIASDIYLLDDTMRFTVEAYDWDLNDATIRRTAHIKTYMSILFYNHIYALAGIDDLTRTDPETGKVQKDPNYFFGAGLRFTDQDLKALFGTASLAL